MVEDSLSRAEVQTALMQLLWAARKNGMRRDELVYEHCVKILAMLDPVVEEYDER